MRANWVVVDPPDCLSMLEPWISGESGRGCNGEGNIWASGKGFLVEGADRVAVRLIAHDHVLNCAGGVPVQL